MKICVLQPSYEGSTFEYRHYDPPRDLSHLLPGHEFHHEFLRKVTTFRQLRDLGRRGFDVFVNLCEGYLDSDVPSIDVIMSLDRLGLPYTGPTSLLYNPSKDLMKRVAHSAGVPTPRFVLAGTEEDAADAACRLEFPLFVKPHAAGDSMGIDRESRASAPEALVRKARTLIEEYGKALIEEYVDGREYTVLAFAEADPAKPPVTLLPVEFRFPEGEPYKTYDMKVRRFLPERNIACDDPHLSERLKDCARRIFTAFAGEGYARMDFRVTRAGVIRFLDVNFACSVFYPEGFQGSADYILQHDGLGQAGFLRKIIAEGLARHRRKSRRYAVRPAGIGYGIFATGPISKGEVVFAGEERAQRIVTRSHVERAWSPEDREVFERYAYPLGPEVYVLWDQDPDGWAPQNHSCSPNTRFSGLDVVALRNIDSGEELTIDYATFCGERMPHFDCRCGAPACRGRIHGTSRGSGPEETGDANATTILKDPLFPAPSGGDGEAGGTGGNS